LDEDLTFTQHALNKLF